MRRQGDSMQLPESLCLHLAVALGTGPLVGIAAATSIASPVAAGDAAPRLRDREIQGERDADQRHGEG